MKQTMDMIGIAGQKQNGKDTLADYLATRLVRFKPAVQLKPSGMPAGFKNHLTPWGRGSFASEVKRIFCDTFMFDPKDIDKWKVLDESPPGFKVPVRKALTMIGDGFRDIMGDVWIRRALHGPDSHYKVYSDIRYLNEARHMQGVGGVSILICHPGRINFDPSRSESELRPYVQWCLGTGREGEITSWPEFKALEEQEDYLSFDNHEGDQTGTSIKIPTDDFRKNLSLFDLFIRNDETIERFHSKVDEIVIPYLKSKRGYKDGQDTT